MTEYIEREAVLAGIEKRVKNPVIIRWLGGIISEQPAADVAPVVRCEDCKHSNLVTETEDGSKYLVCKHHNWWVNSGYFCASGEKNGR